jgi:hypothetical protein
MVEEVIPDYMSKELPPNVLDGMQKMKDEFANATPEQAEKKVNDIAAMYNEKLDQAIKEEKDEAARNLLLRLKELYSEEQMKEIIRTKNVDMIMDWFDKALAIIDDPVFADAMRSVEDKDRSQIMRHLGMLKWMRSQFKKFGKRIFAAGMNKLDFVCPRCQRQCSNKKQLQLHIKYSHKDAKDEPTQDVAHDLLAQFNSLSAEEAKQFLQSD